MTQQTANTLSIWLKCTAQQPCQFAHFNLMETQEISQITPQTKAFLRTALINAKVNLNVFQAYANRIGWARVEQLIVQDFLAKGMRMRRGFFGEVLMCKILEQFSDYTIPVQKWRHSITSDQSLPGTDTIAIKTANNSITEVCYVESKLRTTRNRNAAVEGYDQLKADFLKDIPDMLIFVLSRLEERNDPLFSAFQKYVFDRKNTINIEKFYLGLTWEDTAWKDETLKDLESAMGEPGFPALTVNKTRIVNLAVLVAGLYEDTGLRETLDED